MKSYYLNQRDYDLVKSQVLANNGICLFAGLVVQNVACSDEEPLLVCAYQSAIKSGNYDWMDIPDPSYY